MRTYVVISVNWPILYINSLYKIGQDFFDRQYGSNRPSRIHPVSVKEKEKELFFPNDINMKGPNLYGKITSLRTNRTSSAYLTVSFHSYG